MRRYFIGQIVHSQYSDECEAGIIVDADAQDAATPLLFVARFSKATGQIAPSWINVDFVHTPGECRVPNAGRIRGFFDYDTGKLT